MVRNVMRLRPQLHLPLRRVALCLDCEVCFELGPAFCPACGSRTWTAIARFLEHVADPTLEEALAHTPAAA
jgi:hypothetical protein